MDGLFEAGGEEVGIIARADEGAAVHEGDAELFAVVFVGLEEGGGDELFDTEFTGIGLEVLADGDDVAANVVEIGEGFVDFGGGFSKADHDARFDEDGKAGVFGMAEDGESSVILCFMADTGSEGADCFDVVIEDLRFLGEDEVKGLQIVREIGDEEFNGGGRVVSADGADDGGHVGGPLIR